MDPAGDPGWRPGFRFIPFGLVPGFHYLLRRKAPQADGLILLRGILLAFATGLVLIGVVVVVLEGSGEDFGGSVPDGPAAAVVALIGVVGATLSRWERPLDCDDDARLAKTYTQRFFLRIAFSEAAALAGFVAFILTDSGWMYALGVLFTAIGFARLAPTAARLAEDEDRLRSTGCARSLVVALRENPPRDGLSPRRGG